MNKTQLQCFGKTFHYPKIWAISDTHFGHEFIRTCCNRPFASSQDMDEFILAKINGSAEKDDLLIFTGDFCYWKKEHAALFESYMEQIYCQNIYFVFGNHDYKIREVIEKHKKVKWAGDLFHCEVNGIQRVFFHYPMSSWYKSNRGSIHYHGHIHNSPIENVQNRINICVEMTGYRPVEIV